MGWLCFTVIGTILLIMGMCGCFIYDKGFSFALFLLPLVCLSILGAIISGACYDICTSGEKTVVDKEEYELVQAGYNSTIDGRFGLSCGVIEKDFVYLYYFRDKDGAIKMDTIKVSNCRIIETDDNLPRVVLYRTYKTPECDNWFIKNWLGFLCSDRIPYDENVGELIIPKGTIIEKSFGGLNIAH